MAIRLSVTNAINPNHAQQLKTKLQLNSSNQHIHILRRQKVKVQSIQRYIVCSYVYVKSIHDSHKARKEHLGFYVQSS